MQTTQQIQTQQSVRPIQTTQQTQSTQLTSKPNLQQMQQQSIKPIQPESTLKPDLRPKPQQNLQDKQILTKDVKQIKEKDGKLKRFFRKIIDFFL